MSNFLKALIMAAALLMSACSVPNITNGTFTGTAEAVLNDGQPAVNLGAQLQLDFGSDAAADPVTTEDSTVPASDDGQPSAKPLLDLIGFTEGTDKGDGYNETLAYGAYTGGDVKLTDMTLAEIDALQTTMLAHPNNVWDSSAIGRYQIVRTTLRKLKASLQLNDSALFTPELQDRLAVELLNGRGYSNWVTGEMSDRDFGLALSKEWASLPNPETGKGYYSGQHAAVSYIKVEEVLDQIRR